MKSVLLQALAVASIGLLSPGSISLVILLLMSGRGGHNGMAFALGYIVMYALIGVGVVVFGGSSAEITLPAQSLAISYTLIGLGVALFGLAIRTWIKKSRQSTQSGGTSRFAKIVDGITPLKSFALAATVTVVNVKNLAIFLAAVSVLLLSKLPVAAQFMILIPLVLVFCMAIITPVFIYLLFPNGAGDYLNRIKNTINRYSRPLGIAAMLILACLFLYRGISGL